MNTTNTLTLHFSCARPNTSIDAPIDVYAFKIYEEISTCFEAEIYINITDTASFMPLLQTPAVLSITDKKNTRFFHGIISYIEKLHHKRISETQHLQSYKIILRPKLWQLNLSNKYQVYANKKPSHILSEILSLHEIEYQSYYQNAFENFLEYCVQYNESNYNFFARLLESQGVYFNFTHTPNTHTLKLCDTLQNAPLAYDTLPLLQTLPGQDLPLHTLQTFGMCATLVPSSTEIRAYCVKNPSQNMMTQSGLLTSEVIQKYLLEIQSFDEADQHVNSHLSAVEWEKELYQGTSTAFLLSAGYRFGYQDNEKNPDSGPYCIYTVTHYYSKDPHDFLMLCPKKFSTNENIYFNYYNTFTSLPAVIDFKPKKRTIKPKIHSALNALVVGPAGQDIWADDQSRVQICFFWQNDLNMSSSNECWVRVAQNWAGNQFGIFALPRIGTEVLVTFLDGDPDHPIISGVLYNQDNRPHKIHQNSPESFGISSASLLHNGRSNQIILEDQKNNEKFILKASKDLTLYVQNKMQSAITGDRETVIVKGSDSTVLDNGSYTLGITTGDMQTTIETGNYTLTLAQGHATITTAGALTLNCASDLTLQSQGALSIISDTTLTLQGQTVAINGQNTTINSDTLKLTASTMELSTTGILSLSSQIRVTLDFPGKTQLFPMT